MLKDSDSARRIPCPGPQPYTDDLSDLFFGREREIGMILDRIKGQRLSVLYAASASGKTSLLQAGLLPVLRSSRISRSVDDASTLPVFPLLLNQWLGRAGTTGRASYVSLFAAEIYRYLTACERWYRSRFEGEKDPLGASVRREVEAIGKAKGDLCKATERLGICTVTVHNGVRELIANPGPVLTSNDDRSMVVSLLEILSVLKQSLGSILLILDQFEEVLGDPVIGRQAIVAVESVFLLRKDDVRQFLSLRNDSLYLLEPLEKKSILETKRRVSIIKLDPLSVLSIVNQMSKTANVTWIDPIANRLIRTFTRVSNDIGIGHDVNLLGLQIVLKDLFSDLIRRDTTTITADIIREYCEKLAPGDEQISGKQVDEWLEPTSNNDEVRDDRLDRILCKVAPRAWIEFCLEGRVEDVNPDGSANESGDILSGQIKPMVMRMAEVLVTPTGFKRPMTLGELEYEGFRKEIAAHGMAGRPLKEKMSADNWKRLLARTCGVALDRLLHGHVLKKRGGSQGATYELVHDQFGLPLRDWAELFKRTPEADLGSPYEITDKSFPWTGDISKSVGDGGLDGEVWLGCKVEGVYFPEVSMKDCNFSRTLFRNCVFSGNKVSNCVFKQAKFEGCTFVNSELEGCGLVSTAFDKCTFLDSEFKRCALVSAAFDLDCSIKRTNFIDCALDSFLLRGGTLLDNVIFFGGSMRSANLDRAIINNCKFEGKSGNQLPMRNLQLIDCKFAGSIDFNNCLLDGATIGAEMKVEYLETGDMSFCDCNLNGAELRNMRFSSGRLSISGGSARGAVFENLILTRSQDTETRGRFCEVVLTGAVFLGCELRDTVFLGKKTESVGIDRTESMTLVIRHIESDDGPILSVLDTVRFLDLDLNNASYMRCRIEGPVTFENCDLSGGTFAGSHEDGSSRIAGHLRFRDGCQLTAMEFNTLNFTGWDFEISDCSAAGVYFYDVTLAPDKRDGHVARFTRTDMPGSVFKGCRIHGVLFEGAPKKLASLETLVFRGTSELSSTLGNCSFEKITMENFTFDSVAIDGPLSFSESKLTGGTVGSDNPLRPMQIGGDFIIENECDISAIEFKNCRFEDNASLIMRGGSCRGALFDNLVTGGTPVKPAVNMDGVDLSGTVFLGCTLGTVLCSGVGKGGILTPAWGLVIRGGECPARIGNVVFNGYDCDGGSFRDIAIAERLEFQNCSLLRVELSNITALSEEAQVDVRTSDVLYAEIGGDLLDGSAPAISSSLPRDGILVILPGQWKAAKSTAEGRKHLKYAEKKR